jgi:hypothetical protein
MVHWSAIFVVSVLDIDAVVQQVCQPTRPLAFTARSKEVYVNLITSGFQRHVWEKRRRNRVIYS